MASFDLPSKKQVFQVGVAVLILFALLKFLPVPENIRAMFRV